MKPRRPYLGFLLSAFLVLGAIVVTDSTEAAAGNCYSRPSNVVSTHDNSDGDTVYVQEVLSVQCSGGQENFTLTETVWDSNGNAPAAYTVMNIRTWECGQEIGQDAHSSGAFFSTTSLSTGWINTQGCGQQADNYHNWPSSGTYVCDSYSNWSPNCVNAYVNM